MEGDNSKENIDISISKSVGTTTILNDNEENQTDRLSSTNEVDHQHGNSTYQNQDIVVGAAAEKEEEDEEEEEEEEEEFEDVGFGGVYLGPATQQILVSTGSIKRASSSSTKRTSNKDGKGPHRLLPSQLTSTSTDLPISSTAASSNHPTTKPLPPISPSPPLSSPITTHPLPQQLTSPKSPPPASSIVYSPTSSEPQEKQAYGGVYIGPAAGVVQVEQDESGPDSARSVGGGGGGATGLIRRLSRNKSQRNSQKNMPPKGSRVAEGKVKCRVCKKKCAGDILRADENYFHIACFACKTCNRALSEVGFFTHNEDYYCPSCYHASYGTKCPTCQQYVEGEIVQFMDKTFHKQCFNCSRCKKNFPSGENVTWTGREYMCRSCLQASATQSQPVAISTTNQLQQDAAAPSGAGAGVGSPTNGATTNGQSQQHQAPAPMSPTGCAACGQLIESGQVLLALEAQWHITCFKCNQCSAILQGEYMAKDGKPFCIKCYNSTFGVRCYECDDFIAGRVLQAGGYQFHPTCARCSRCGDPFGDGQEMYMQGDEIWHPACNEIQNAEKAIHQSHHASPKTTTTPTGTTTVRGRAGIRGDGSGKTSRSPSRGSYGPKYTVDFGQHLTYMYLLPEQNMVYLKQPIGPHPPTAKQFHTPQGTVKIRRARVSMLKTGMQKMMESLESEHPRPKSPHMDNEEPIEMAAYPAAHAPFPEDTPAIDRDDFPAPPYPYAIEEVRRRLSESEPDDDDDDYYGENGDDQSDGKKSHEEKAKRAEEELKKLEKDSSLIHAVVVNMEEEAKKAKLPLHWDPRSASRTPSAKKLPHLRCRYESPINASPSRYLNRPRPWEYWSDGDRAATTMIPYSEAPKPGYGLAQKSATLPVPQQGGGNGYYADETGTDLNDTRESAYSQHSMNYTSDGLGGPSGTMSGVGGRMGGTMPLHEVQRFTPNYAPPPLRTSLPDMTKPPKIYTLEELMTTNKKLPEDVDRCHLERHLPPEDFHKLFKMTPMEFYKLPDWKRVNLKRTVNLF